MVWLHCQLLLYYFHLFERYTSWYARIWVYWGLCCKTSENDLGVLTLQNFLVAHQTLPHQMTWGYITPSIIMIIGFCFLCRLIQGTVLNFFFRSISIVIVIDFFLTYIISFNSMIITCRYFIMIIIFIKVGQFWFITWLENELYSLFVLKYLKVSANKKQNYLITV